MQWGPGLRSGFARRSSGACCDSCAHGGACEGGGGGGCGSDAGGECASGFCGVAKNQPRGEAYEVEHVVEHVVRPVEPKATGWVRAGRGPSAMGRAAGGVYADDFGSNRTTALTALLGWRGMTAQAWFAASDTNRRAWATSWAATVSTVAADRTELVNAVMTTLPSHMGLGGGAGGGGAGAVPANWSTMSEAERTAWARRYSDEHGLTAAERAALEQRAREADAATIRGYVSEGLSLLRELIRAESAADVARIQADARRAGDQLADEQAAEQRILNAMRNAGVTTTSTTSSKKSGGAGAALGIMGLALLLAKGA